MASSGDALPKLPITHFLQDILRQPNELQRTLHYLPGDGQGALAAAVAAVRSARHVYLTGIGSSWHVGLNVSAVFQLGGRPVYLADAAELVQFAAIPAESVLIVISRSGRSVEIVQLLGKARESGATVIGITNAADGALAREAQIAIVVPVAMDHAISVNTYTTLALAAGILADSVTGEGTAFPQGLKPNAATSSMSDLKVRPPNDARLADSPSGRVASSEGSTGTSASATGSLTDLLSGALAAAGNAITGWQAQIENSEWLGPRSTIYF